MPTQKFRLVSQFSRAPWTEGRSSHSGKVQATILCPPGTTTPEPCPCSTTPEGDKASAEAASDAAAAPWDPGEAPSSPTKVAAELSGLAERGLAWSPRGLKAALMDGRKTYYRCSVQTQQSVGV